MSTLDQDADQPVQIFEKVYDLAGRGLVRTRRVLRNLKSASVQARRDLTLRAKFSAINETLANWG
jgi:hypothetical protein